MDDRLKFAPYNVDTEGRIHVDGDKTCYFQGIIRTFRLDIGPLTYFEGYQGERDRPYVWSNRLAGTADLGGDALALIACKDVKPVSQLKFSVRPVPDSNAWRATIGFIPADWELQLDDMWYLEAYMPEDAFQRLLESHVQNRAIHTYVGMDSDLWTTDIQRHMPHADDITWYLAPDKYSCKPARCTITQMFWSDRPKDFHPASEKVQESPIQPENAGNRFWGKK